MNKCIALVGLALVFTLTACTTTKEVSAPQKSLLKCATCGVEFTDPKGLDLHKKEHKQ